MTRNMQDLLLLAKQVAEINSNDNDELGVLSRSLIRLIDICWDEGKREGEKLHE